MTNISAFQCIDFGKKQDIALQYVSGNQLAAKTGILDGAKLLLKVKMEGHHAITVR